MEYREGQVTSQHLANGAVAGDKIADDAIQPNIQRVRGSFTSVASGTLDLLMPIVQLEHFLVVEDLRPQHLQQGVQV